jgi:hypothetical protein
MAQVPFTSFYLGPLAIYTASTGLLDPITGAPERGGNFQAGNYCDLSEKDAQVWNQTYNPPLPFYEGRYRIVKLLPTGVAGNVGYGRPAAWASGSSVQQVSIAAQGDNYVAGTYIVSSTASGGTAKATAQVVIGGADNGIISATLLSPGAGFTSVPTFPLTELTGGAAASLLAQMLVSPNVVQGFDSSAIALAQPRGIFVCNTPTAAQVTAGAYVVLQEAGIANVLITTATNNTTSGNYAAATNGGIVTVSTPATAFPIGYLGTTLDLAAANTLIRVSLELAMQQG